MKDPQTTVQELKDLVQNFVDEREWQPFHDPKNLSMSIAIETGELMEHFQWLRTDQLNELRQDSEIMSQINQEVADILCYVLSLATSLGIDLASALESKMEHNRRKYPAERYRGRFQ